MRPLIHPTERAISSAAASKHPLVRHRNREYLSAMSIFRKEIWHAPAAMTQFSCNSGVTRHDSRKLPPPIWAVALGNARMVSAAVPKATVHKNRHPLPAECEIGPAKHGDLPPPAGQAVPAKNARQGFLGFLISGGQDFTHYLRPLFLCEDIRPVRNVQLAFLRFVVHHPSRRFGGFASGCVFGEKPGLVIVSAVFYGGLHEPVLQRAAGKGQRRIEAVFHLWFHFNYDSAGFTACHACDVT